jgi:hypothetical protein
MRSAYYSSLVKVPVFLEVVLLKYPKGKLLALSVQKVIYNFFLYIRHLAVRENVLQDSASKK